MQISFATDRVVSAQGIYKYQLKEGSRQQLQMDDSTGDGMLQWSATAGGCAGHTQLTAFAVFTRILSSLN